jgi:hypothetical protein
MLKPLISAALLTAAVPAAAVLPAPYYSTSFESVAYDANSVITHDAAGVYDGPASVADPFLTMTVGGTPTPFISVRAHGAHGVYAEGGGSIEYFFAVAGPAAVVVPLSAHIIIDATVATSAFDYGGGGVDIYTDQGSVSRSVSADNGGSVPPSAMIPHARIDEWVPIAATTGDAYQNEIQISGGGTIEAGLHTGGYANVYIDPVIAIDPVWAAAHPGYSLSFSAGVGNSPAVGAVPEPASWVLLVAGFGIAGAVARRRRVVVAA